MQAKAVGRSAAVDTVNPGLSLTDDILASERSAASGGAIEWSVRLILILGFTAVLALEAYLIWEGLALL